VDNYGNARRHQDVPLTLNSADFTDSCPPLADWKAGFFGIGLLIGEKYSTKQRQYDNFGQHLGPY
jgi:hypothetical protein